MTSKAPLATWFRAIYHLTYARHGISPVEFGRHLGIAQITAWKMKTGRGHAPPSDKDALGGRIEMYDANLGGERSSGKKGRGSPGKNPPLPSSRLRRQ